MTLTFNFRSRGVGVSAHRIRIVALRRLLSRQKSVLKRLLLSHQRQKMETPIQTVARWLKLFLRCPKQPKFLAKSRKRNLSIKVQILSPSQMLLAGYEKKIRSPLHTLKCPVKDHSILPKQTSPSPQIKWYDYISHFYHSAFL